ncbi:MAG TPA: DUF2891 domain-containing protein [Burkholderiaceae bacterium]|nr:DUF2891 domain-containing protein [Burkholderiaceae bacterium]
MIDADFAASIARTALQNVATEYPYKLDQVLGSGDDLRTPSTLHPVFHGSYDWHSCVHMHWTLARLLRLYPKHAYAESTRRHFEQRLSAANLQGEIDTLSAPHRGSFERPYGWGWLLKLAAEFKLLAAEDRASARWFDEIAPLAQAFADRFVHFLPRATYATRAGTHGNSAFALLLALDYCEAVQHPALHRLIAERANLWFGRDRRYAAEYEPSGDDFLSSGLVEAALMRRVVDGCSFADWWQLFRPSRGAMAGWLQPVQVSDASDPKIVHLHGLNLSRAWCWRLLLPELDGELKPLAEESIETHIRVSLQAATAGDYVGTHWLASFAVLALTEQ